MSTTLSPTASSVTPAPTASTMPAASWPSTVGAITGNWPFGEREVGVTDAAVAHAHEHFARAGIFDVDVVDDFERLLGRFEQGGTHDGGR